MTTPEYKVVEWSGEPGLMVLAQEWADECGIEDYSPDAALNDILDMRQRGDCKLFALMLGEEIVGGLGITILDMFWSDDCYSAVRYCYVKPLHRPAALKLIAKARKWSMYMRCPKMLFCSNTLCKPTDKFLKALQFKEFETVYIRDI